MTATAVRQGLIDLTELSRRELFVLWNSLADLPESSLRDALMVALPAIAAEYGAAAAALAADWYDDLRDDAGVRGRFIAEPADLPDLARWESLVGWALRPESSDPLALVEGGLQRTVADQHRLTVVENTQRDPQAKGWRRVGVGASCGFCRMLIGRGGVYTGDGVTFRSHDHCNCAASPTWDDKIVKISPAAYEQSKNRPRSDAALKKRNRAAYDYIRENYGDDAL